MESGLFPETSLAHGLGEEQGVRERCQVHSTLVGEKMSSWLQVRVSGVDKAFDLFRGVEHPLLIIVLVLPMCLILKLLISWLFVCTILSWTSKTPKHDHGSVRIRIWVTSKVKNGWILSTGLPIGSEMMVSTLGALMLESSILAVCIGKNKRWVSKADLLQEASIHKTKLGVYLG